MSLDLNRFIPTHSKTCTKSVRGCYFSLLKVTETYVKGRLYTGLLPLTTAGDSGGDEQDLALWGWMFQQAGNISPPLVVA